MKQVLPLAVVLVCTSGCQSAGNDTETADLAPGVIEVTYQVNQDDQGSCRPRYEARTQLNEQGMPTNEIYIIRGDTRYFDPQGRQIGSIPFQLKMADETISVLNEFIACKDLTIEVTVEECVYAFDSKNSGCPPIAIEGQEGFGDIVFIIDEQT
ncbi:hypothetical protein ACFODZ_01460 [Marinicella sediminis]|uniref:Lipoprotein n=1 Tax=Marinicella sediminis TaxID=1792834 RepID=A0ABV7JBT6_9GAMM|nr:hypothetical protein [Marinicella sediminis]